MAKNTKSTRPKSSVIKRGVLSQAISGSINGLVITVKGVIYMKK